MPTASAKNGKSSKAAGQQLTKEELIAKAQKPNADAMKLHPFYRGKIEVSPKCCVRDFDDFAIWYSPGVAAPCKDIAAHPETVYEHTNKANMVAVVSDGTRVLGLGEMMDYPSVVRGGSFITSYSMILICASLSGLKSSVTRRPSPPHTRQGGSFESGL